jgi:hypothetical protein
VQKKQILLIIIFIIENENKLNFLKYRAPEAQNKSYKKFLYKISIIFVSKQNHWILSLKKCLSNHNLVYI